MMYCVGAVHSDLRSTAISHIGYVRRGSVPYFVVRTQGENRGGVRRKSSEMALRSHETKLGIESNDVMRRCGALRSAIYRNLVRRLCALWIRTLLCGTDAGGEPGVASVFTSGHVRPDGDGSPRRNASKCAKHVSSASAKSISNPCLRKTRTSL